MHIRLPKPMHGWRAFLGEVGIIVLGVLIALGAEQLISDWHDRTLADDVRAEVGDELNDNLASVALRAKAQSCIERRLGELRAIFDDWSRTGTFDTPQWVAQAPSLTIRLTRYEAALDAGRIALLPGNEQYRVGAVATGLRQFQQVQDEELRLWGRLRGLQAGAAALGEHERALLRLALQDAAALDYQQRLAVRQLLPMAASYGYRPNFERVREMGGRIWASGTFTPSICTSIDTPRDVANRTQVVPLPL